MKARATDVQIRGLQDLKPFSYGPYSLRVGLRYTGRSVVSVAFDHMRYKVVEDQTVDAVGSISAESYPQYGNLLSDGQIELTPEVFRFEHTDGLNYVSVEHDYLITRIDSASRLHFWTGLALGAYIPRTESYVLDDGGNHKYHLSGWGTSVHTQVQWRVAGSLFIEGRIKAGYIDLNDILLGSRSSDARASQRLGFVLFTCSGLYLF
ncbi:MAG: hypothetical protein OEQ53_08085 [Saprospiraceae bacterium]|nr:hypothetical protein [Saprospiraceae bacterium]